MPRSEHRLTQEFLDGDPLLMTGEVAELFRVDPATVGRWVKEGRFPQTTASGEPAVTRSPGNHYRFRASVVRGLINGAIPWRASDGGQD